MDELPTNLRPELLLSHAAWLRRLAGTLVVDAARADDVAQETLLHALERPPAKVASPRAWLATAARNLARSVGRGERRREEHERRSAVDVRLPATDEVVARTALHHEIVGAVLALAEPYRTTVLLRFFEEQKPGAIARRMRVPVETVRTRLKRGVELLRGELVRRRASASISVSGAPRIDKPGEWAVALIGLLDQGLRHSVRRALLAKAAGAGTTATIVGTSSLPAALEIFAMATKWKVAAAVVVVAVGALLTLKLVDPSRSPSRDPVAPATKGSTGLAAGQSPDGSPRVSPQRTSVELPAKSAAIHAQVVDDQGNPIAGAHVGVLTAADESTPYGAAPPLEFDAGMTATTGASGECDVPLASVDARRIVDLAATADGFNAALWKRARSGETVFLTLTRASELSGLVRDLSGAPVAGATIRWTIVGPRRFEGAATTGVDGRYHLANYPGPILLVDPDDRQPPWFTVTAAGFAPMQFWGLDNVRADGDRRYRLDLWLVRGATIRGHVVDLVTGAPVADADVWIQPFDPRVGRTLHRTKSVSDGSYLLEHVPAWGVQFVGMYSPDLNSRHLGVIGAIAADRGFDDHSLEVPDDGEELAFDFKLAPLGGVRGRVVDAGGAPIEGAFVGAAGRAANSFWHRGDLTGKTFERTLTDANGRYEIASLGLVDGVATKVPLNARVERTPGFEGEEAQSVVTLVAGQFVAADDLVLKPFAGLAVHVVDEAGRDVAGAVVDKWTRTEEGPRHDDGPTDVKTGSTGRCFMPLRASPAAPRRTVLSIGAVGFASIEHDLASETGEVTVALAPEHRLRGVIRDVDGRLGGGEIVVVPAIDSPDDLAESLRTDEFWKRTPWETITRASVLIGKGRFVVRGLGPGPWHVAAMRGSSRDKNMNVAVAADVADEAKEVEVVLPGSAEPNPDTNEPQPSAAECGRVELTLTFADSGRPVLRAGYVSLRSGKLEHDASEVAPGRFIFERVAAGSWDLYVDVRGAARETRSVVVAAGQTTNVAISITRGAIARGRVKLADLPPFKSASVLLVSDDGGGGAKSEIASDGSFAAPGLVAGKTYWMWAYVEENDEQSGLWVDVEPARSAADAADWSPHLVPAGVVIARFHDEDRFPDGVVIRVFDGGGKQVHSVTLGRAHGIERVVPVGDYVVKVDVPGLETQEQPVAVRQHERATELYFKSR